MNFALLLAREEEGQVVLEYALLLVLFALAVGWRLRAFPGDIHSAFSRPGAATEPAPPTTFHLKNRGERVETAGPSFHSAFAKLETETKKLYHNLLAGTHFGNIVSPR